MSRCWTNRHIACHVRVLEEEFRVESLFLELATNKIPSVLEFLLDGFLLQRKALLESVVVNPGPAEQTIDFVERNDERCLPVSKQSHGFNCLRLKTVHNIDNQDRDVTKRRTSGT